MASAGQIKGITIKIDGDSQGLAKSLSSVNSDLKKTNSALKDVEKALKLDPNNVELLEQKQKLLNQQIEQTRQKLELEREAAAKAKDALDIGNISQEEYASLTAEVATTAAQLDKLETEANQSGDALEDTGDEAKEAGEKAKTSGKQFVNWGEVVKGAAKAAAAAVAAVGTAVGAMAGVAVAGGKKLVEASKEVSEYGDMVDKASQRTGMAASSWQRWNYVMEQSGTSMTENEAAFKKMTNMMDDALNGSKSAVKTFQTLGISLNDLKNSSREEIFEKVISGLQDIDDEARRAAVANDIFSKSGQNMLPMLNSTKDEIQDLLKEADDYGIVMSDDMVKASAAYDDALNKMESSIGGLKNRLVGQFLPGLTDVVNGIAGMAAGIDGSEEQIQSGFDNIISVFDKLVPQILTTVDTLLPSLLNVGLKILSTVGQGIISNLSLILDTAMSLINTLVTALLSPENVSLVLSSAVDILMTLVGGLIDAIDLLIDPAVTAVLTLVEALLSSDNIQKLIDAAIHIVMSLLEGLTKSLPRLIPVAVSAVTTICNTLLDHLDEIILAAEDMIVALAMGLLEALPDLLTVIAVQIIPKILNAFIKLQLELPKKALEWGKDLITSLVKGITNAIPKLKEGVSKIASTIASYLHFSVPDVGPLAKADTFMPDMIDLFSETMTMELPTLKSAVTQTAGVIAGVSSPDYTGVLNGISNQIGGIGNNGTYVINFQVGTNTLATAVINAQQMEAFRSGGV